MELWIVRHGETVDNKYHVLQGQQPGKLSEDGIAQARQTGIELAKQKFSEVFCSDLGRTKETLNHILEAFTDAESLKINYSPLIRERSFGVLEGLKRDVYRSIVDNSGIPNRDYKPEGGESWYDVHQRAIDFLDLLNNRFIWPEKSVSKDIDLSMGLENGLKNLNVQEPSKKVHEESKEGISNIHSEKNEEKSEELPKILVISHSGYMRELLNVINFIITNDNSPAVVEIGNCSIHVLKIIPVEGVEKEMENAKYEFIRKNDVSHIKA